MTPRQLLKILTLACSVASLSACRDPAELSGAVTAVLVVVGVDDDNVVEVDIDDASRRASPKSGDNLVSFNLPLAPGTHVGTVVVFEVEDEGEEPRDCGRVTIVVPAVRPDGPVLAAIVADELGECPGEDDEAVDPGDDVEDGGDDGV
jgi:hypothetical protein